MVQIDMLKKLRCLIFAAILVTIGCKRETISEDKQVMRDSISVISKEHVFEQPQPFLQCHASTVLRNASGKFLVAWFGGTHEKHDDVGIWFSKGGPGNWSAPVEIAKIREDAHWNPVLFQSDDSTIVLFFKVGKTIDHWETWYKISNDDGETWSEAKELVAGDRGGRGPVRNKPLLLADGTWLAPASNEKEGVWNAFFDRSEDGGKTWTSTSFVPVDRATIVEEGVIQPALWESSPGNVHALLRSSTGVICRTDSKDNGNTWSPVYKTTLPNPNSGIDLTKLDDGTLVLAYNPDDKNWGERQPISLAISNDNGETWATSIDVETGKEGDEFSYPSIIHFGDSVALTYTWKRQSVAFVVVKVE
jgi:predicted neuraminidase